MKASYRTPTLVEYGQIDQLTLGASGPNVDATFSISTHTITTNANAPTCFNNVGSGYCYKLVP